MPEGAKVQKMFAGIAKRYDFANLLLSGGCSFYWTRRLVAQVKRFAPKEIADLATGSGDVAFELKRRLPDARVRGFDFCEEMLAVARERAEKIPGAETIEFAFGDCMALPLEDASVDAVTIAYGVRNFEDRPRGLREIRRVLKPGGKVFILEFTQPAAWFRPIYFLYLKFLLPLVARAVTGDKKAYDYLAGSIEAFPRKERLAAELRDAGFSSVRAIGLTASIVAIHVAEK
ncbi:MAG: bifunctional demethylmenaquinone methyltransferase/2-methoxy-6-polyprenyl-1,4-benzoquinol methylase UbiE [Opitutales bacterium]|nr:bifunctional demethylmenaquinone methyltransferase/2-methoxy-6-polyprenyl-1,4-benzoquinol methylase UbiE [Opitutales bacterium]